MTTMNNEDPADPSPHEPRVTDAYRCIAPACKPLGCSDCNSAVPADVYAALGRAFQDAERERQTKPPKWWTCPTHGDAKQNAWGCPECVREMRGELVTRAALIAEVLAIASSGTLPDGDAVNTPTLLWAEEWRRRLAEKEVEADMLNDLKGRIADARGAVWLDIAPKARELGVEVPE